MEEQIKQFYAKMKYLAPKSMVVALATMALVTLFISIFEGNPFPHEGEALFFTYWDDGWILNKTYLWVLTCLISILIEWGWQIWYLRRLNKPFTCLLDEQCDPVALRWVTMYGMNYGRNLRTSGEKSAFYFFEYAYVTTLNALGEYEEAIRYLENEWQSQRKNKIRNRLLILLKLNDAVMKEDKVRYMKLCEEVPAALKNNSTRMAQYEQMQGNYSKAIEILSAARGKELYVQVSIHYGLAKCYLKLGNRMAAREHLEFVMEHGNTTYYKKFALEEIEKLNN